MAHEIVIPRLGWSMEEGTFVGWLKKDGDFVRRGEAIFELEGEKALQEIESVDEGILRIPPSGPNPGSVLKVGAVVGYLVAGGESTPGATIPHPVTPSATHADVHRSSSPPHQSHERTAFASPRARRVAGELGIDWTQVSGTGARGRVRESDVRAAVARGTLSPMTIGKGLRIPHTSRRRVIAQRMLASRQQTVPVTLTTKADASNLVNLREQFQAKGGSTLIPSYQDIITKLVGETLKRHPLLAGRWEEDAIVLPAENELHLGIAVDTEDGLLVPVIRNVGGLSLASLARQSRHLIEQARAGTLVAADMQGGVFTITNLGACGIDAFTPIINLPESAILGLGSIRRAPTVLDDGQIVARHQLTLSLTFDHHIIDGASAARFLQTLVMALTNPSAWLLGDCNGPGLADSGGDEIIIA